MFKPGKSGNPRGRPKGSGHNQRCKEWADKFGFEFLEAVAEGREDRRVRLSERADVALRVHVAQYLIDRGYGKAIQSVEHAGNMTLKDLVLDDPATGGEG